MARTHEALRLLVSGSLVALQPSGAAGGKVETLSLDMVTGDVKLTGQPALSGKTRDVLALIGAFRLRGGTAVAVVTGAQKARAAPLCCVRRRSVMLPCMRCQRRGAALVSSPWRHPCLYSTSRSRRCTASPCSA